MGASWWWKRVCVRVLKLREASGLRTEELVGGQMVLEKEGVHWQFSPSGILDMGRFPFLSQAVPASQIWPVCLAPPSIHKVACDLCSNRKVSVHLGKPFLHHGTAERLCFVNLHLNVHVQSRTWQPSTGLPRPFTSQAVGVCHQLYSGTVFPQAPCFPAFATFCHFYTRYA